MTIEGLSQMIDKLRKVYSSCESLSQIQTAYIYGNLYIKKLSKIKPIVLSNWLDHHYQIEDMKLFNQQLRKQAQVRI